MPGNMLCCKGKEGLASISEGGTTDEGILEVGKRADADTLIVPDGNAALDPHHS